LLLNKDVFLVENAVMMLSMCSYVLLSWTAIIVLHLKFKSSNLAGKLLQKKLELRMAGHFPKVLVTVGTTNFDKLISEMICVEMLGVLRMLKAKHMKIQTGLTSKWETEYTQLGKLRVDMFAFKDNIEEEYDWADIIISHGGAGTIMDTLERKKPLIVVPNEDLMGGHQDELAEHLAFKGHLVLSHLKNLRETLKVFDPQKLIILPPVNPTLFVENLLSVVGISKEKVAKQKSKFSITALVNDHDRKKKKK